MIAQATVPWTAHPEVWLLVAGALSLAWFASRVVQPKAVAAGFDPITRNQKIWFGLGIVLIWGASDWPVHDVAENHLYSVHMAQHLLLSMMIPACFVLATPRWLFDILIPEGSALRRNVQRLSKPIVAGIIFNALTMWLHWSRVVQWSADSGAVHFAFHLMVFSSGLLMWMPVIGPVSEWRLAPLGQCIYLFMMSIVPTVPGGWLVFAQGVVYRHYDTPERLWNIDVLTDQQAAGLIMKLAGGFFLWAVIVTIFSKWARQEGEADRIARVARHAEARRVAAAVDSDDVALTYEDVSDVFASSPAPVEKI